MHSQVTPPLRPYETPTPPDSEGEDEPEEEEENEEEEVESVFIPISFSFFYPFTPFFPQVELVDERILKSATPPSASCCSSLVSDPSNMQEDQDEDSVSETSASSSCSFSASARRRRWVILREEVQLLLLFLLFLFLLLIILIITISRSSCRRRLAEADMESLSEVSTRGGLWRSRFRHHHRKLLSCCQDGDLILLLLLIITILINLIIISKVSNPLRNRSDYETAQEGIVREVGTFCRCKHPSLVRYLLCHIFIKLLSVSIPVPVSVPVPGANTPVLSGTCASLSHFYQDTFYTNTCTCICFCTW